MSAVDSILEELLDEKGTGIFVQHLRTGDIYTCKCPACGTLHGAFRSYLEAQLSLKCKRCNRNEVNRRKKELEKVDQPEKRKDIFTGPMNKPKIIGEGDEADDFDMKELATPWSREQKLVSLAIEATTLVLPLFERDCPGDDRPRKAIEAAQAWLSDPSEAAANAAYTAGNTAFDARVTAAFAAPKAAYYTAYAVNAADAADAAANAAIAAANAARVGYATYYALAYANATVEQAAAAAVMPELKAELSRLREEIKRVTALPPGSAVNESEEDEEDFDMKELASPWTREQKLVSLAIETATLVLPVFERDCPGDDRPRKAIEAAQAWLTDPSEAAGADCATNAADAAYDALATYASYYAAHAAHAAVEAAYAAFVAYPASAAYYAARTADAAYWAANAAAYAADANMLELRAKLSDLRKEIKRVAALPPGSAVNESEEEEDFDMKELASSDPYPGAAYEIFDGCERFPVTVTGLIGRSGWDPNSDQFSEKWRFMGLKESLNSPRFRRFPEIRMDLEDGKTLSGYVVDYDHGAYRTWSRRSDVYKKRFFEDEEDDEVDIKSIITGEEDLAGYGKVTKEVCMAAYRNQEFYSRLEYNKTGFPKRVRVSGRCLTWKTRPNEFKLPVKYGLYQSLYITDRNADEYSTVPLSPEGYPL